MNEMISGKFVDTKTDQKKERRFWFLKNWKKIRKFIFPILLVALIAGVTLVEEVKVESKSAVYVFDVGQGDGILVKSKAGVTVLIDGGPTSKIVEQLDSALPYSDREIDYMISTHPHADHVTGLVSVLERFPVHNVIMTGVVHTTDVYLDFLNLVKEKKPQVIAANKKKVIGDRDVIIELLSPQESLEGKTVRDAGEDAEGGLNDTSVVSRITLDGVVFLFPGDAGAGVEKRILEAKMDVKSDVLVLAHHGSKTASSEEWLRAVKPQYAVISAGVKNKYGLPAYLIVRRVERLGIPVYRTDQDGTLEFLVGDGKIKVKKER